MKVKSSGWVISGTIAYSTKIFLSILIHIKVINLRKFHFCMTVPLEKFSLFGKIKPLIVCDTIPSVSHPVSPLVCHLNFCVMFFFIEKNISDLNHGYCQRWWL